MPNQAIEAEMPRDLLSPSNTQPANAVISALSRDTKPHEKLARSSGSN